MLPVCTSIACTPCVSNGFEKSVTPASVTVTGSGQRRFGRLPADLVVDARLSDSAVRVYAVLALQVFSGNVSAIGIRQLCRVMARGPETILKELRILEQFGHIRATKGENGRRSRYELTSPVFGKPGSGVEGELEMPASEAQSRHRPTVRCPRCHQERPGLLRIGWCRSCNWADRVRIVVREELRAFA